MPLPRRAAGPHHRPPSDGEALRRENERLRQQVEQLRQQLKEQSDQQSERLANKDQEIAEAEKKIADLERQLALRLQNSTTSSKPPSSDGLAGEQRERGRRKTSKSKRKPGGQPGHKGACRLLAVAERVDEFRTVLPVQCHQCGHSLPQTLEQATTRGAARLHQVTEVPPIRAHIIEYQCHSVLCPHCGDTTRAALPEEAAGQFGPQLTALIAYLTVVCRMPRRVVETLLKQVLEIDISLGSTQKCWEEVSEAVAAPCQELAQNLKNEPVVNADETGWRTSAAKRFLWVFAAAKYIVYKIAPTRSGEVLIEMLGAVFQGILCSDRFSAYIKYHPGQAQFCWAHLKRNLLGVMELTKNTEVEQFCRDALAEHARLFRLWHKFRDDRIDRRQLVLRSIPIQKRLFALGVRHLDSSHRDVRNLAAALFEHIERLFAFVDYEGVEPTNNSAERALRTGVQWRKTSFGNRSASGELATARLLTVTETCDLQKLNILAYLSAAITRHRRRQTPVSLLPR
jgi:transposase